MEWGAWGGVHGQVWLGDTLPYLFADGAEMAELFWVTCIRCVSRVCVSVVSLCLVRTRGVGGPVARAP